MKALLAALLIFSFAAAPAQVLLTYGRQAVTVQQFLKAWHRNNTGVKTDSALHRYLDLYIASRLKIQEARNRGLDTSTRFKEDMLALKQQLAPAYIIDKATMEKLLAEAFHRSQQDLRLQHIFISFQQGQPLQMEQAKRKKDEVLEKLKKGVPFEDLARDYSDDPTAKTNQGHLGWITVFSLPYLLENLAYNTEKGKVAVGESNAGYHLLKLLDTRPAAGSIKAAQILLAYPPQASEDEKSTIKILADSIYKALLGGADFGILAQHYSNDMISASSKGLMPLFGPGDYEPAFEEAVYQLKPGEISKPVASSFGWHIVKLIEKLPPPQALNDSSRAYLLEKIQQSDRIEFIKNQLAEKIFNQHSKLSLNLAALQLFTDSVLNGKHPSSAVFNTDKILLQIGNKKFTVADWQAFAAANRSRPDGSIKSFSRLWYDFRLAKALEFYTANLENFSEEFSSQLKEFEEGNLFFEVMQTRVWTPAQSDTAALLRYFEKHKKNYQWNKSADAIIFYAAADLDTTQFFSKVTAKNWRQLISETSDITADSARFEWVQLPNASQTAFREGALTPALLNPQDNSLSFALVVKTYPQPQPKNFSEARAEVVSDYQEELDKAWLAALRKKYPVVLNKKVWDEVVKSRKWK